MSSTRHFNCAAVLAALPQPAFADGGISAIGALLPAFFAMGLLGVLSVAWIVFTLVVAFSAPTGDIDGKLKIYKFFSGFLVGVLVALALLGIFMNSMPAVLVLLAEAGLVAWISSVLTARAKSRVETAASDAPHRE